MSLEHLIVWESKEVLKNNDEDLSETKEPTEKAPNDQIKQHKKVALLYNPTYKINIHESTLIQILNK